MAKNGVMKEIEEQKIIENVLKYFSTGRFNIF
jgi:hypothetical protein